MSRLISFSMTTEAYRRGEKTVTRRDGWWSLKPGDVLMGVEKAMGLKKGEHVVRIHPLRVIRAEPEPLRILWRDGAYARLEMVHEGFPDLTPREFCQLYIEHNGGDLDTPRNRIEFEHLAWPFPSTGPRV